MWKSPCCYTSFNNNNTRHSQILLAFLHLLGNRSSNNGTILGIYSTLIGNTAALATTHFTQRVNEVPSSVMLLDSTFLLNLFTIGWDTYKFIKIWVKRSCNAQHMKHTQLTQASWQSSMHIHRIPYSSEVLRTLLAWDDKNENGLYLYCTRL